MRIIDIFILIIGGLYLLFPSNALAFGKLTTGLQTITSTYLVPLAGAVAGTCFLIYVILSFFKQDEYQRKIGNVLLLSVFTGAGLELIQKVILHFN